MEMKDLSCAQFLAQLASKAPTPGGGGTAALAGAAGVALGNMVGCLTTGKKKLDGASAVPLQIMEKCAEGIALAEQYAAKGSVLAVSDAGCAAVLCKAALQAASLNVFINTKLMADRTHAAALDARADALLAEFVPRADEIFTAVSGKLRNK